MVLVILNVARYFVIGNLAKSPSEIIRLAGLLRGTESAWQAISVRLLSIHLYKTRSYDRQYGFNSVAIMASVGGVYLNLGLWAVSLIPAWLVVSKIGLPNGDESFQKQDVEGYSSDKMKE